ncbi:MULTISPECIES: hypothetical protein [unclassified Anaeromyxobacter]|uniref:hypothetical protein n=1 Tax=unclassified Anaeromyxobacter TaxID=2620896 RepID=UPI001F59CE5F|nr:MULTISPECIES: hypothetical protein [unclassified Anaeromyxobacter]
MAGAPENDRATPSRQEPEPEREREQRRGASDRPASERAEGWEDIDPREEEGWSQPESSAQKGALPDEG